MAGRGRPRTFDRTEALRAAMQVFWTKTYNGTSLKDLTAAMGINSPSLYAAFGSKEALFREALDHYAERRGSRIWRALSEEPNAKAAVSALLERSVETYCDADGPPGCMIVLGAQHGWRDGDPIQLELAAKRRGGFDRIRARLVRGIADGDVPADFDIDGAVAFYVSVQTGMSILARDGATRDQLASAARGAIAAWESFAPRDPSLDGP